MGGIIKVWIIQPKKEPVKEFIPNMPHFIEWQVGLRRTGSRVEVFMAGRDMNIVYTPDAEEEGAPLNFSYMGKDFYGTEIIAGEEKGNFADCGMNETELRLKLPQAWQ